MGDDTTLENGCTNVFTWEPDETIPKWTWADGLHKKNYALQKLLKNYNLFKLTDKLSNIEIKYTKMQCY